jgi:isoquinoline 1-oxidoreductase alpha subunit
MKRDIGRELHHMAIETSINGKTVALSAEPDTPLLWVIREELGLT